MEFIYFMSNECKVESVDIEQDGKIVTVAPRKGNTTDFTTKAESIAYSFMGVANINCEDFVNNYVYVEKLSTGEVQRVLFAVEPRGMYLLPVVLKRECICENQLMVLRMINNLLLE